MAYRAEVVRVTLHSSLEAETDEEAVRWAQMVLKRESGHDVNGGIVEEVRLLDSKGNRLGVWAAKDA